MGISVIGLVLLSVASVASVAGTAGDRIGASMSDAGSFSVSTGPRQMLAQGASPEYELEFWKQIEGSDDPDDFRQYLKLFPKGVFVYLAEKRLRKLGASGASGASGAGGGPVAAPVAPPASRPVRGPAPGPVSRVDRLLSQARNDEAAHRLTSPRGNNAYERYQQVLRIEPGNRAAEAGMQRMYDTYARWFNGALAKGGLDRAAGYLRSAGRVRPNAPGLGDMQRRLDLAQERVTAPPPPQQRPEPEPPARPVAPPTVIALEAVREAETGMIFVRIPGGCFTMGSPEDEAGHMDTEREHRACVDDFAMARHEVSNAQFRLFKPGHDSGSFQGHNLNGDDQPAVNISWAFASDYARWLSQRTGKNYRLPTEAEWEYAARGGSDWSRFWGHDASQACTFANVQDHSAAAAFQWTWDHGCDDGHATSAPVGSFSSNVYGLHDMIGNVYEWTCSAWNKDYSGLELDCEQEKWAANNRVLRGGSWVSAPINARIAFRLNRPPIVKNHEYGFRLVLEE